MPTRTLIRTRTQKKQEKECIRRGKTLKGNKRLTSSIVLHGYTNDVCKDYPKIQVIPLENNRLQRKISKGESATMYPLYFHKMYPKNSYAKFIVDNMNGIHRESFRKKDYTVLFNYIEYFEQWSYLGYGLSLKDIKHICNWAKQGAGAGVGGVSKTILLRWDFSILIMKDALTNVFTKKEIYSHPVEDVAMFFSGTKERFDSLIHMFRILRENQIHIFIITDNERLNKNSTIKFFKTPYIFNYHFNLLKVFDNQIKESDIIVGSNLKKNKIFMKLYNEDAKKK